jgi:hypothetical protein
MGELAREESMRGEIFPRFAWVIFGYLNQRIFGGEQYAIQEKRLRKISIDKQ